MKRIATHITKLLILIMSFTLILSACQPTPEASVVVNKNEGALKSAIAATPIPSTKYEAPEVWTEELTDQNGEKYISIDAQISIPDVNAFPAIAVKPGKFSQQQVDLLVQYFSQGKPLNAVDDRLTKAEIEQRIVECKADLELARRGDADLPTPDEMQAQIDSLTAMLETAPETKEERIVEPVLALQKGTMREGLEVTFDAGGKKSAKIRVLNCCDEDYSSTFGFDNFEGDSLYQPMRELYGHDAQGLKTTLKQAEEKAREVLSALGLSDYAVDSIETGVPMDDINRQGYIAVCRPVISGIPVIYSEGRDMTGITIDEKTGNYVYEGTGAPADFAPSWGSSHIKIFIDDNGIISLRWFNLIETEGVENENVRLIPFDEVQKAARHQLKSKFVWESGGSERIIHITQVRLALAVVPKPDDLGHFLLVPAWVFSAYFEYPDMPKRSGLDFSMLQENANNAILVLNAVDGSVLS